MARIMRAATRISMSVMREGAALPVRGGARKSDAYGLLPFGNGREPCMIFSIFSLTPDERGM